ncbi:AMP-binding protein [Streptomyces bambusae]|uniref:phenylacetate--CoA ligase family protein n=1 Tax=Streptomyces bambusae TaxID=1550616 RepID=UPI001CFDA71C|nr:AMP-binding protein [Streptomyces bambusae]MCB5167448.1 AMP-binding protein [Streptomyces bambusae]
MRQRFDPMAESEDERHWRSQLIHEGLLFPQVHAEYERYSELAGRPRGLRDLQGERLAAVLRHALDSVPAYRRTGITADDTVDPWQLLSAFPTVRKAELAEGMVDHCDDAIDPTTCRVLETSGTSGVPLRMVRHNDALVHEWATALVRNQRQGKAFDRKVLMPCLTRMDRWGEFTSPGTGFTRVAQFGLAGCGASDHATFAERARGFRPEVLAGTPRSLVDFMELLRSHGGPLPGVRSVVTCGELLVPGAREALAEFFGRPVTDMYAMKEVGTIAVQCEAGSYHVESERLWLEIVDDDGVPLPEGRTGEIVITDLINRAMPLIRYRTGDFGSLASAPCGCGLPHKVMDLVEGRNPGELRRPDGTVLPVLWAARAVRRHPVRRYQIVQEADFSVTVLVAPAPSFTAADSAELTRNLEDVLGSSDSGIRCRVRTVGDGGFHDAGRRKDVDFVSFLTGASRLSSRA